MVRMLVLAAAVAMAFSLPGAVRGFRFRQKNDEMMLEPHTAVDLTADNFQTQLGRLPADTPCIIKFYASWCPHCHHYAPVYEKAAKYFKALGDRSEAAVFVGRIDCAEHIRVCSKFSGLQSFPSVMVATVQRVLTHNDSGYTYLHQAKPSVLIQEVGALLNRTLAPYLEPPAPPSPPPQHSATAYDLVWSMTDVESATRMLWHFIISTPRMHTGSEVRLALHHLLRWWALSHACHGCRDGASHLLKHWESRYWPAAQAQGAAPDALTQFKMCNQGLWNESRLSWLACRGAKPGSRGFTCGLWLLFHTSAARLPGDEGHPAAPDHMAPAQVMVAALRGFAQHFFQCEVCQKHFAQIMVRPELEDLQSRRDAVLWLWRTHNEVNARLAMFESAYGYSSSGDPAHPKLQWPTQAQCPACRTQPPSAHGRARSGRRQAAAGQGRAARSHGHAGNGHPARRAAQRARRRALEEAARTGVGAGAAGSQDSGAGGKGMAAAAHPVVRPEEVEWNEHEVLAFLDRCGCALGAPLLAWRGTGSA